MADSDSLGIAEMVKRVAERQNTQACEIQKSKEVLTQMQVIFQKYFTVRWRKYRIDCLSLVWFGESRTEAENVLAKRINLHTFNLFVSMAMSGGNKKKTQAFSWTPANI